MDQDNRLFLKGLIFFLTICFLISLSFSISYSKDTINADLFGKWGYSGSILTIKILQNSPTDHYQYAYCGTSSGLLIIDVSDPNRPKKIVFFEIGEVRDVEFFNIDDGTNNYAALVIEKGLRIFDISDPIKPTYTGGYDTAGSAYSIVIQDHYAFVADQWFGLFIIDITDPISPEYVGRCNTAGYAYSVVIKDQHAFVADDSNGLVIIDISDLTDPKYVGGYDTFGTARGIALQDNYAFVANFHGLVIIDISNPADPKYVSSYETFGEAYGIALKDHYAFIADGSNGLATIDIIDPTTPKYTGGYDTSGSVGCIAIQDHCAFVGGNGLVIIDITDPPGNIYVGRYDITGSAEGIAIQDRYAFVADSENGLVIIDISDPVNPKYTGGYDTPGQAECIAIQDHYAFIGDSGNGLVIIDISDPTNPTYTGRYENIFGSADAIAIQDHYAFVAYWDVGLVIIDISDPTAPKYAGRDAAIHFAECIVIQDNLVFVAGYNGLVIIDISDPTDPKYVGGYYIAGWAYGIAIQDNLAFVTDVDNGLVIIDISDPTDPKYVGGYDTSGSVGCIAIQENFAFVAVDNGLVILDISNPTDPKYIGGYDDTAGSAREIVIQNHYAFVADGRNDLVIIDIIDPIDPKYAGGYDTDGLAFDIAIQDHYAFIADGDNGLVILDISDPKVPKYAGEYDTAGQAEDITIQDQYAFIADGDNGLVIIDIIDSTDPKYVGGYDTPGLAHCIAIQDHYAFVGDSYKGLVIIDISDPKNPKYVGRYYTVVRAYDIAIQDHYAFLANHKGLVIIDISDPTDPKYTGGYDTAGSARGIAIQGHYAFIADGDNGLVIIDISNPKGPIYAGESDFIWSAYDIVIRDHYAFIADSYNCLVIMDITDPIDSKYVGEYNIDGFFSSIAIQDHYAFILDGGNGLVIIDISDPAGLKYLGMYDTGESARGITIQDHCAFIADAYNGLVIIDIIDPTDPKYVGGYDTAGCAYDIAIQENFAFVADCDNGLVIIDISDPTDPKYTGGYDTPEQYLNIAIQDNYAFVLDNYNGLLIIDISNPREPKYAGGYDTTEYVHNIAIQDHYAFMAYGDNGLVIIDISNPKSPIYVRECDFIGSARDIVIQDHYAFIADADNGLVIIDISDPVSPEYTGGYDTDGYPYGIAIQDNYAFVASYIHGLDIIDITNPTDPKYAGGYDSAESASDIAIQDHYAFVAEGSNGVLVFNLTKTLQPQGNLILCPGGPSFDKNPLWPPYQALADKTYLTFMGHNFSHYFTYYLTPTLYQDTDGDGLLNYFDADDFDPTVEDIEYAITDWAYNRLNTGPLYICLMGHGAENRFQIMPNEVVSAQELKTSINRFRNGYIDYEGAYHPGTDRPVVVIIESGASGTFIDDLAFPSTDTDTDDIFIITSTGPGPSYVKPSPDPDTDIPISFIRFLIDALQNDESIEDYQDSLKEAFIFSREQIYQTGHPFLDQAPQMYVPEGPIALTFTLEDPNTALNPLIITQRKNTALRVVASYPDGATMTLDPGHLHFLSSQPLVFDTNDPSQIEITSDQILILPEKNGLSTFIAYPDPGYYPNILLTARLPLDVSIPENTLAGSNKAIIVAGYRTNLQGEPDYLWEETNTIANHAYKSLRKKGYSREDIFYLSPHFFQDIDENQSFDDIDRHPTVENLTWAFDKIKDTGAQELLLFLVDHGTKGKFNISTCCEDLSAQVLGDAILSVAPMVKGHINILIDACHSGSFTLPEDRLFLEQGKDPNDVILITSSGKNESAYFDADGIVSFSYPFFDQYLLTNSLQDAFDHARFTIPPSRQTPAICTQRRARERDKELVYYIDDACPVITQTEFSRGEGKLFLLVQVYSLSGIKRVWALILSSEQAPPVSEASPGVDAPLIELSPDDPNAPYGGWYSTVEVDDPYPDAYNYQILLCAQDKTDKITTQRTNISNYKRDATGAIVLVTDPDVTELITDPKILEEDKEELIKFFDKQSNYVYQVLKEKGIEDDDIYYLKVPRVYNELVDAAPNLANVRDGIPSWLEGKGYDILLVYLLGQEKKTSCGEAYFSLNKKEDLSPDELGAYIQPKKGCRVIFFCDIPCAKAFIEKLPLKDRWIGVASTDHHKNWFKINDDLLPLFSELFFKKISRDHLTFGRAYEAAGDDIPIYYHPNWYQNPCILRSDPLSGFKELSPKEIVEELNFYIGSPRAGWEDSRLIKSAKAWEDGNSITLELKVKESVMILPPQAYFETPSGLITSVSLVQDTEDPSLWSFFIQEKNQCYSKVSILVQQIDESGQTIDSEQPVLKITRSIQKSEADTYEDGQVWPIVVNNRAQLHTFHNPNDTDWVYFFGHTGHQYDMSATDGTTCRFIKLSLTDPNGKILIQSPFCRLRWQCPQDGYYYIKAEPASEYPAEGIGYTLFVESLEYAKEEDIQPASSTIPGRAAIIGRVINLEQKGVNGLCVNLVSSGQIMRITWTGGLQNVLGNTLAPSKLDGWCFIPNIAPGVYDLTFTGDDPNVILKKIPEISLSPNQIKRIEDIVLDLSENWMDVISEFYLVYTQYQNAKEKDYPEWGDNDKDGLTNLEEFLDGTDPDSPVITLDMSLPVGWSMISIPVMTEGASVAGLFPDAEVVYAYEKGLGYKRVQETEELEVGRGYWILLKEEKNYALTGHPVFAYTLSVNEERWEMIGVCTYAARALADSCHIGVIYGYDQEGGYVRVPSSDDLEPGKGYWILIKDILDQCELIVEGN